MGNIFARGRAWADSNYIVNLTTSIVGKHALLALSADPSGGRDAHALCLFFWPRIKKAIREMTDETLGRICAYGGPEGLHVGPACSAEFLNMTGYKDVCHWQLDPSKKGGRAILEELAILTIACVARDIIRQSDWQANFARELAEEDEFDRGMRDYIHHGHS